MKGHQTIVSVFNVAIVLLLVFNSAHSESRRSYEEPRASSSGNWKWPLNQNNAMGETKSLRKMNTAKNGNIAFLADHTAPIQPRVGSVIPSCKGLSYCEDIPNYPTNLVKDIIARNPHLVNYTSVDMIDMLKPRLGEDSVETESFCASSEHVVLPKTAENMNNEWKYILNNEELKQGVRIEKCINEGQRCSITNGIPMGYETTCKQKFVYNQLLGLEDDGSVVYQHFRFPSSCCCHVKFIGTSIRIGGHLIGTKVIYNGDLCGYQCGFVNPAQSRAGNFLLTMGGEMRKSVGVFSYWRLRNLLRFFQPRHGQRLQ